MTADFRALFEGLPGMHLVLAPDLTIVAASDAYLRATMTRRDEVIGRGLFEVFPDNPDDPTADGTAKLRASLERVRATGVADEMAVQKYDIRRPAAAGGGFEERHWLPRNAPLLDADGRLRYFVHTVDDVTAQVRLQRAQLANLREVERWEAAFNQFFTLSLDLLCIASVDGYFKRLNPAFAVLGYSDEELLATPFIELVHPDDVAATVAEVARLAGGRPTTSFENRYRCKDGSYRWLAWTAAPAADGTLYAAAHDITEAKRQAEAAADTNQFLEAVLEHIPHMVVVKDAARLAVVRCNRAGERLLGVGRDALLGRTVDDVLPPAVAAVSAATDREALATRAVVDIAEEHVEVGGVARLLRTTKVPLLDAAGQPHHLLTIAEDITVARRAAGALATRGRELEIAARLDHLNARVLAALTAQDDVGAAATAVLQVLGDDGGFAPLAWFEYDPWRGALRVRATVGPGAAAEPAAGIVAEAAAGRQPVFRDGGPPPWGASVEAAAAATWFALPMVHREQLLGVVAGGAPSGLRDRERAWLTQVAAQVAVGVRSIRQFQELKAVSAELNVRSLKVEAQNRELAHANRLKSEFLASMSHELRTPLNAIIGFSEVLKDGLVGPLTAEQHDYVTEVFTSGRHLLSLINDILDLSKIEAGKMELSVEHLELAPVIDNALTILKERAARGGVAVSRHLAADVATIAADGRKLRQIIYNLLSNAVKFTPPGGAVRLEVTRDHDAIELAVIDTGIGIAAADLPRLFEPFVQLDGGLARRFEGTGLGLVMVKNLVELHGGTIGVTSEVGRGSRFWVRLPQGRAGTASRAAGAATPIVAAAAAPTVLVVDDDPAAVELARRWLGGAGFLVESAATCALAWDRIVAAPPDAILLDILFDGSPAGWELLTRLRSEPALAAVPVVVVSIVAELERGLALGAVQVLQKPVAGAHLIEVLRALHPAAGADGVAPRVLVVDDDPGAVEHIARSLEAAGLSVARAYGGADAITAATTGGFAAMVLDLMMPEVSGFEVVRRLRAEPATAALPIVVLTATLLDASDRDVLVASVSTVMAKDAWDEQRFVQMVRSAVASRWSSRPGDGA